MVSAARPRSDTRAPRQGARVSLRRFIGADPAVQAIVTIAAGLVLFVTVLLVYELWKHSALSRATFRLGFLSGRTWDPNADTFGALPFAYGTLVTSALALTIAVPAGVGAAIFLAELAPPRLSAGLTFCIELLAAVPSVIYGLIGVFVGVPVMKAVVAPVVKATLGWTPLFSGPFYGVSMLTAGFVLAIMILPFIVSVSRQVLLAVPRDQREGALALGATQWESTWRVVLPYARRGIAGSIFLGLARSLGETMAVTMVIGNTVQMKATLFAPAYTIAAVIANEFSEATSDLYVNSLIELGLVLFAITIVVNGVARLMIARGSRASVAA